MKDIVEEITEELDKFETVQDAVDMAIKLEEDGRAYYLENMETMENPNARELYLFLAEEEKKHAEILRQFKDGNYTGHEAHDFPDFTPLLNQEYSDKKLEEVGVLLAALRFEYKSEYLYTELAKRSDNPEQKLFFEKIAAAERGHYKLIDELLEDATQFRMQT